MPAPMMGGGWVAHNRNSYYPCLIQMSGKVPVPEHNYEKHCCLDSAHYYTMSTDLGYGTGGYVFWNPDDRLNYACIQYEEPDKIGAEANCRDCQDEIMKCQ